MRVRERFLSWGPELAWKPSKGPCNGETVTTKGNALWSGLSAVARNPSHLTQVVALQGRLGVSPIQRVVQAPQTKTLRPQWWCSFCSALEMCMIQIAACVRAAASKHTSFAQRLVTEAWKCVSSSSAMDVQWATGTTAAKEMELRSTWQGGERNNRRQRALRTLWQLVEGCTGALCRLREM